MFFSTESLCINVDSILYVFWNTSVSTGQSESWFMAKSQHYAALVILQIFLCQESNKIHLVWCGQSHIVQLVRSSQFIFVSSALLCTFVSAQSWCRHFRLCIISCLLLFKMENKCSHYDLRQSCPPLKTQDLNILVPSFLPTQFYNLLTVVSKIISHLLHFHFYGFLTIKSKLIRANMYEIYCDVSDCCWVFSTTVWIILILCLLGV